MAGNGAGAVALAQAMAVPALDGAGVALALADAHDVDVVASGEHVGLQDVAHVQAADVGQTELPQGLFGGDVRLEMCIRDSLKPPYSDSGARLKIFR